MPFYHIVIYICLSPVTIYAKHLSMGLVLIGKLSFIQYPFKYFRPFSYLIIFLKLGFSCSLYFIDTSPLFDKCVTNIFSESMICLFIFLIVSLKSKFLFIYFFCKINGKHQERCNLNELSNFWPTCYHLLRAKL